MIERARALVICRARALGRRARVLARGAASPLGAVLAVALVFRLTGLAWGLPGSDGWDDDGVAPRDFLVGVVMTYWPGHHNIYPPLHLIGLTIVSAPVWIAAALRAGSLQPEVLVPTFIQVPTMTALAVVARAATAAMSLGVLWTIAAIGEDLGVSRRAGAWTAAACGASAVLTYYAQTTNLEVPYLFWSILALRSLVRAIVRLDPRGLARVPVLAALAVATKDQAYGLFLAGVPLTVAAWLALDPRARPRAREIVGVLAAGSAIGVALLLVLDGAVSNPSGFGDRVRQLLGSASQDHALYPKTWAGRGRALYDSLRIFPEFYPWAFAPWVVLGLGIAGSARDPARRAAGLAPLFFAASFTAAFNMAARRAEHRFVLPQMTMWGIYAGLAFDAVTARRADGPMARAQAWLCARVPRWPRARVLAWAAGVVVIPTFALALFRCAAVDVAMILDPRYDAERWMGEHVGPGDRVEVYGNNVHLPRLPSGAAIERVDPAPLEGRSPLPGVVEVRDDFSNVRGRNPRFVVVPEFWADRYLLDPAAVEKRGRVLTPQQTRLRADVDSRAYFEALRDGRAGYHWAHLSEWTSRVWPRVDIHASLTRSIWIFEKD
jgi:hypothetical protein